MNVELAFTPQSHWTHIAGAGSANGQFAALSLSVPPTMRRRLLYVHLTSVSGGSSFAANGVIQFTKNGRVMCEQVYRWSSPQLGEVLRFSTGQGEDGIRVTINGTNIDLIPHEFIVECDTIRFVYTDNLTSGGVVPMWVFACKSETIW